MFILTREVDFFCFWFEIIEIIIFFSAYFYFFRRVDCFFFIILAKFELKNYRYFFFSAIKSFYKIFRTVDLKLPTQKYGRCYKFYH